MKSLPIVNDPIRLLTLLLALTLGMVTGNQVVAQATYDAPPVPQQQVPPNQATPQESEAEPAADAPATGEQPKAAAPDTAQPDSESMPPEEKSAADESKPEEDPADLGIGVGFVTDDHLQDVFIGKTDPNLDDLRQLQYRVNELVDRLRPAVVGIRMQDGQGSGVIVTSDGYILTAAHVVGEKGRRAQVVMPDGTTHSAVVLGTNAATDSGMLRMLEKGPWPYVPIGESGSLNEGQWVMALGHPGGFDPDRNSVVRVGRMLMSPGRSTLQTDCTLVGGDSGGPLFDLDGYVIGIHSRISRRIQQNYHVAVDVFTSTWDEMSEDPKLYFGFSLKSREETDKLIVSEVEGPVARGGMKVDDEIIRFNGKDVKTRSDIRETFEGIEPFAEIEIVVRRRVKAAEESAQKESANKESEGDDSQAEGESENAGEGENTGESESEEAPAQEEQPDDAPPAAEESDADESAQPDATAEAGEPQFKEVTLKVVAATKPD